MKSQDSLARQDVDGKIRSKPRYTVEENELIYENWWNPKFRKELSHRFNRKISALRSQFCRLLKERNVSNDEYYRMMRAKYLTENTESVIMGNEDDTIIQIFAKHQVLGSTRTDACGELRNILQRKMSDAALKLRFYRLIQKRNLSEVDLYRLGQEVLNKSGVVLPSTDVMESNVKKRSVASISRISQTAPKTVEMPAVEEKPAVAEVHQEPARTSDGKQSAFLYQLAHLPEITTRLEEKVAEIEKAQRHQLDLRGFIEHLLAVERNLKKEDRLLEEIDRLNQEIEQLKEGLSREKEKVERRERELSDVYRVLNTMLTDFMNLESVAKLASLGDFMKRLEVTVDQFGNVLKTRRVQ